MSIIANPQSCVIKIGEIPIGIRTADRGFFDSVRERYAGFLNRSVAEIELDIEISSNLPASDDDVHVQRDGSTWSFSRGDFQAEWNTKQRRGVVRQRASAYALDSALRILHSLILAERGGFLLHAASAICEECDGRRRLPLHNQATGRAVLFSGVSGAGKTTITRLAPRGVTLLSDEISYVGPNGDNGYCAFGTPFSGELAKSGENCSAPIAALFFLEKGPENRTEEVSAPEAVERLMRNILFFAEDRTLVENLFAAACDFVQKVPVLGLTFYPDGRVWDDVRNFDRMPEHA